ncbi:MFS transporter [Roseobacter sp. HKCCD9010]|uniref:MFS transporter n=1 Tax=unclassified Roseobacter TaxID=196798 RepID=UPI0014927BA5|nr:MULTISPECIES: MFS transporter [unclassified Roseobacter]MBF9049572.1 MFS transporter [Rhodobacterales bacterium HKCCD4356]NNV11572.1 MFS transporter [Roseobacter sp. HKCCD7357]NNV15756.1 MFS transporter [Roseobacter sp. HKCCD8768]NNV25216.1 MFS transporter [Roseobacter sp. HKCCD8192]NNV29473.1 MFS transporter [Roseobacter sp. HKCCD9061]
MSDTRTHSSRQNWTVVAFGFLALSLAFSSRAALGLIMPVWQTEFGWTSSYISSVGAAALVVMAVVAPFAGRLVDRRGTQFTLNLGMGLLGVGCAIVALMNSKLMFVIGFAGFSAIGFGIVATHVVATAVTRSFSENQGLATGIGTSGATGGQFLIVPLIAALLAFASWRWSFGALSLASLALIPCIRMSMRADTPLDERTDAEAPSSSMRQDLAVIVRQPAFHLLFWSFLICGFTTTGVIETHLLPFAAFCGFPPIPSATAYGLLSLVNLIGMIAAGWLTDRVNRPMLLASIYMLRALTFILLGSLPGTSIEMLFLFAVLFGAVDYSTVPVTASLVASHVGIKMMGLAMGMISAGHAIGGAMGAFAGGYLFTATQTYDLVWTGSVWLAVGAGVLALFLSAQPTSKATA